MNFAPKIGDMPDFTLLLLVLRRSVLLHGTFRLPQRPLGSAPPRDEASKRANNTAVVSMRPSAEPLVDRVLSAGSEICSATQRIFGAAVFIFSSGFSLDGGGHRHGKQCALSSRHGASTTSAERVLGLGALSGRHSASTTSA